MASKIDNFTSVSELAENQCRFIGGGNPVYVLGGSGEVPSEITGTVTVTDIHGVVQQKQVSEITLSDSPIFVELK